MCVIILCYDEATLVSVIKAFFVPCTDRAKPLGSWYLVGRWSPSADNMYN